MRRTGRMWPSTRSISKASRSAGRQRLSRQAGGTAAWAAAGRAAAEAIPVGVAVIRVAAVGGGRLLEDRDRRQEDHGADCDADRRPLLRGQEEGQPGRDLQPIAEELRGQYLLSYTPDKPDADSEFHKVAVKAKDGDLVVTTREGYFSGEKCAGARAPPRAPPHSRSARRASPQPGL